MYLRRKLPVIAVTRWSRVIVAAGLTIIALVSPTLVSPAVAQTPPEDLPRASVRVPTPGTTWQWQLTETINTGWDVQMYDIDLFEAPQSVIDTLHTDERIVICYFSAGSYEDWRPDAGDFPEAVLGDPLDDWEGERWLDIRAIELLTPIMTARLDLAVSKQCDGVEPDNVDGYTNETGFPLTGTDQLAYNTWLAEQAHLRGLSIGLKNDLDQIEDLVDLFDWALNEQCFQYDECDLLLPFIEQNKAVFGVEYEGNPADYCPQAVALQFSWLTKTYDLGDEPPNACAEAVVPTQPTLLLPAHNATDVAYAPVFEWSADPSGGTGQYKVIVKDSGKTKVFSQTFAAAAVCTTVCTVTSADHNLVLPNSAGYTWFVKARNSAGSSKSEKFTFAVEFPGQPVITAPLTEAITGTQPEIIWTPVSAADSYQVKLKAAATGNKVKSAWLDESAACDAACTFTPTEALIPGAWKVWIIARQTGIPNKSRSAKLPFTVSEATR